MKKIVLSIGSYDGIHLGHQSIIKKINEISSEKKLNSLILFFEIPPKLYLKGEFKNILITTPNERKEIIKSFGINEVISIDFNDSIHFMEPEIFFKKFILSKHNISDMVVGRDFALGYQRKGDLNWLKTYAEDVGFNLHIVDFVRYNFHKISSSLIRESIKKGEMEDVAKMLGRKYFISGIVKKGAGIGRKLGYPTANLEVDERKLLPNGVFVVEVLIDDLKYEGVCSIGRRPTLKTLNEELTSEVHILDFNKDIYGKKINVFLTHKIRDEKRFSSVESLINQIKEDISYTKRYFSSCKRI